MLIISVLSGNLGIIEFSSILVAMLIGITVHEYAHALVAFRSGDPTAKLEGRLSLNPLVHLDLMGTLLLLVIGFGYGKPVPINPNNFHHKNDELKVALAGIATNLAVACLAGLIIRISVMAGIQVENNVLLFGLHWLVQINLILAVFNILPIPPLDGSHVVEEFLDDSTRAQFNAVGPMILLILIASGFIFQISFLQIIMDPVIQFLSHLFEGTTALGLL